MRFLLSSLNGFGAILSSESTKKPRDPDARYMLKIEHWATMLTIKKIRPQALPR